MAVGGVNYPAPVNVNGFSCRNCTDVALAQKNIDPSHPTSGPNNRDAAVDPSRAPNDPVKVAAEKRVIEHAMAQMVGYGTAGMASSTVPPGTGFSRMA